MSRIWKDGRKTHRLKVRGKGQAKQWTHNRKVLVPPWRMCRLEHCSAADVGCVGIQDAVATA